MGMEICKYITRYHTKYHTKMAGPVHNLVPAYLFAFFDISCNFLYPPPLLIIPLLAYTVYLVLKFKEDLL